VPPPLADRPVKSDRDLSDRAERARLSAMRMLLSRSLSMVPFLNRWFEATPCCGTCPTCAAVGGTSLLGAWLGTLRRKADD
jgi:hypothetical protein